jgi:hypothetical protein
MSTPTNHSPIWKRGGGLVALSCADGSLIRPQILSQELLERIDSVGDGQISFQQFCVFFKVRLVQASGGPQERQLHKNVSL